MKKIAEYVSPGHPDRLCDGIVENCVTFVQQKDKDALVGLECAVHTNKVFLDGRIAAGKNNPAITKEDLIKIIYKTYTDAGYGKKWYPAHENLEIKLDVCLEKLSDDERKLRSFSDDQNIVCGYACNNPYTNYFPTAHYIAKYIGRKLFIWNKEKKFNLGPDFKVLVQIDETNKRYSWDRFTLSWQHKADLEYTDLHLLLKNKVDEILKEFNNTPLKDLSVLDDNNFWLNGAGDFVQGGPEGDNGLSGKKLVIDFYGPDVAIGGGAICGKDSHKVDVCGAFRARQLAVKLVKEFGYYSVNTRLAYSPGEQEPYLIQAWETDEFGTTNNIDSKHFPAKDWFSIDCINNDLKLPKLDRADAMFNGYMDNNIWIKD